MEQQEDYNMTRRSGRPQHLSLDHSSAVMARYSSSISSPPCLDQALSRFQQVDQRRGTLEGPPPALVLHGHAFTVSRYRSQQPTYPWTRTGPKL
jgi:hypothetical protein